MNISYKGKSKGISLVSISSYEGFSAGDSIICMDDNNTLNITKNRKYRALYIYDSKRSSQFDNVILVQLIDDGNEICSYEANRFLSIRDHREFKLSKILGR